MIQLLRTFSFKISCARGIAICLLIFGGMATQVNAASRKEIRQAFLKTIHQDTKHSSAFKKWAKNLFKVDGTPIKTEMLVKLTKKNPMAKQTKDKLILYIDAWMLRHFDQSSKVISFYKSLPHPYKERLLSLLLAMYPQGVNKQYAAIAEH